MLVIVILFHLLWSFPSLVVVVTITIEGTSFQFETIVDYEFTVRTDRAFGSLVTLRVFTVNVTAQGRVSMVPIG